MAQTKTDAEKQLGVVLSLHPDGFKCQQCGKCCQVYVNLIQVTEEDVDRWMVEGREDILKWVSCVDFGDHIEYDFPIDPVTDEDIERCPFLRKLPNKDVYVCRIHNTKPEACTRFPSSEEEGERIGCPGVVNRENGNTFP